MSDQDQEGRSVRQTTKDQRDKTRGIRKQGDRKRLRAYKSLSELEEEGIIKSIVVTKLEASDAIKAFVTPPRSPATSVFTTPPHLPDPPLPPEPPHLPEPPHSTTTMSLPPDVLAVLTPTKKKALEDWVAANRVTINVPTIKVVRDLRAVDREEERRGKPPLPPVRPQFKERTDEGQRQQFNGQRKFNDRNYQRYNNQNSSNQGAYANPPWRQRTEDPKTENQAGYMNKKDFRRDTRGKYGKPPPQDDNPQGEKGPPPKLNPHADKDCYLCKKKGHIARFCPAAAFFFDKEDEDKKKKDANEDNLNPGGEQ
ncbi:unnamed protein product [Orchesella dallaii]|uniref:CCHC-type domain-containing protein n=1 Tax=Orchesella dallaii TaxID=48710 RepID=A0ABP1QHX4_9HEXA